MYPVYNATVTKNRNFVIIGNGNSGGGGNSIGNISSLITTTKLNNFSTFYDKKPLTSLIDNYCIYPDGLYLTYNYNKLDYNKTYKSLVYVDRYLRQDSLNLSSLFQLSAYPDLLVSNYSISFFICPILDNISTTGVFTKGINNNVGELTVLIGQDGKLFLSWYNTKNGLSYLKSNQVLSSYTKYFVVINNDSTNLTLYINDKQDNQIKITNNLATPTKNNLILGKSFTSSILINTLVNFKGSIENFNIQSTPILNILDYYSIYYAVPNTYLYIFSDGVVTYNGENGSTSNPNGLNIVDQCKYIARQLSQYINGFMIDLVGNIKFYVNLEGVYSGIDNYSYYHVINTFNPYADTIFLQSTMVYKFQNNFLVEDPDMLNDYVKSNNGQYQYFFRGRVMDYRLGETYTFSDGTVVDNYIVRQGMSDSDALDILAEYFKAICFVYNGVDYIFYSNFSKLTPIETFDNRLCIKFINYSMGSINSDITCFGVQNIALYKFNTPSNYNLNTIERFVNIDNPIITVEKSRDLNLITDIDHQIPESYLFVYNTYGLNISNILDTNVNTYVNQVPNLDNTFNINLNIGDVTDIVSFLILNSVPIGRHIIISYNLLTTPSIYNFSITTNQYISVKINGNKYIVDTIGNRNILFHHSKKRLKIELSFNYSSSATNLKILLSSSF
jgi:hypothetical protein